MTYIIRWVKGGENGLQKLTIKKHTDNLLNLESKMKEHNLCVRINMIIKLKAGEFQKLTISKLITNWLFSL